jgi:hypothetical protein
MRNGVSPYRGNGYSGYRAPYANHYPYHGHDHGRNYGRYPVYAYPGWYTYPYVVDPGFYDWGATDYSSGDSSDQQGANYSANQGPEYQPEPAADESRAQYPPRREAYTREASSAPVQIQEYHFANSSSPAPAGPPLTVIFKGGRTPLKMQNYMVNSTSLTDFDREHFEKIPLDQVDLAATEQINRQHGIDFQVPISSRD